jgi:hypothetical protein
MRSLALLFALLVGCRGDPASTAAQVAMQFLAMRDAVGGSGAPSDKELDALRPFITDTLARGLALADSLRAADIARAPDEKPRFVEGDLFSSLFEGATAFRVLPATTAASPILVPVEYTYDRQSPPVKWTDTLVVVQQRGRWMVQDIRYGGTWAFGNKGSLLQQLVP